MNKRMRKTGPDFNPDILKGFAGYGHSLVDVGNAGMGAAIAYGCAAIIAVDNDDSIAFETLSAMNLRVSNALAEVEIVYAEIMKVLGKPS
ncbi:hypothetical protein D3C80_1223250 [compost metagenome]